MQRNWERENYKSEKFININTKKKKKAGKQRNENTKKQETRKTENRKWNTGKEYNRII